MPRQPLRLALFVCLGVRNNWATSYITFAEIGKMAVLMEGLLCRPLDLVRHAAWGQAAAANSAQIAQELTGKSTLFPNLVRTTHRIAEEPNSSTYPRGLRWKTCKQRRAPDKTPTT